MSPRSRTLVRSSWAGRGSQEGGSGVVWILALTAVVAAVAWSSLLLLQLRVERARAVTAADLAALAAAARLPAVAEGCAAAQEVAAAHGASVVRCFSDGRTVEVVVSSALGGPLAALPALRARSRAGPPGAP